MSQLPASPAKLPGPLKRDAAVNELFVTMSNALTRAGHGLTLSEKRLVAACVAQVDSVSFAKPAGGKMKLTASEYAETFGVDINVAYEQLQDASENLFGRYISTTRQTAKGVEVFKFRWITSVRYQKGEGWVELKWSDEVLPHLHGLRAEFTTYRLQQASAIKSIYAWRLFELCRSWAGTGKFTISVKDFAKAMDLSASYTANFRTTRVRIIEPAIAELRDKTGFDIRWSPTKSGRKVVGLVFEFSKSKQAKLFEE